MVLAMLCGLSVTAACTGLVLATAPPTCPASLSMPSEMSFWRAEMALLPLEAGIGLEGSDIDRNVGPPPQPGKLVWGLRDSLASTLVAMLLE